METDNTVVNTIETEPDTDDQKPAPDTVLETEPEQPVQEETEDLNDDRGFSFRFGPYLLYTVCFAVVFGLIFLFYIKAGKSFIQYGDGYRQGYFWTLEFKDAVDKLLSGNGIDFWNWSAGLGRPARITAFVDPFQWLTVPFVPNHVELGYTVSIAAQMYFAGIAFIMAAKKFSIERLGLVLGAITYVFSSWVLNTALVQGNFMENMILFPLLVLGVEKIYEKKTPLLFSLVVAYYMIKMPYFAYMAAIVIVIYIFFRYFAQSEKGFLDFIKSMFAFIVYGIVGIMISMAVLISSFYSLSGASTGSGVASTGTLFDAAFYKNIIPSLMGTFPISGNYMFLGMASTVVFLFIMALKRFSFKNTPLIMSIICGVFLVIPFFNSMFNGFSYPTGRWYFMLLFFVVLTAMTALRDAKEKKASDRIILLLLFAGIAAVLFVRYFPNDYGPDNIFDSLTSVNFFATGINLILAFIVVLLLCFKKNDTLKVGNNAVTFILIITMMGTVLMWTPIETKKMKSFLKDGQIEFKLSGSVQRAGQGIQDDDFYRIDQVNGISVNKTLSKYANETLRWNTRSIYTYDSRVPSTLLYYNKLLGNNEDYVERVTLFSNDNRAGLDLMTGVKYFLGDDAASGSKTSQYSGYGFEDYETIDGVSVQKNKYSIGLGAGFDSFITQSEFEKLSRLEREQALLQAVVVADNQVSDYSGMKEMKAADIDTDIENVPFTIESLGNVEVTEGKIKVKINNASIILHPSSRVTGQLVLSFDDLLKSNDQGLASTPFSVQISSGDITKVMMNKLGNQGISDIIDYDVNLDYFEGYNGDILVTFRNAGEYTYDKMYLSVMDMSNYDQYASALQEDRYEIDSFENDNVEGTIKADADEILYLSIPANRGWEIYVDDKKCHVINDLNYAFTGVEIPKGTHEVRLAYSYPGIEKGLLVSGLGLILLVLFSLVRLIRNRKPRTE